MTTCSPLRACVRISCAHVLRTLAVNGSVWGGLWAEIDTWLPHYTRVTPHSAITWFGQVWISSLTFACCVCRHVRGMCAHAGATRWAKGVHGCRVIDRIPPNVSTGCMWVVGGVLSLGHVPAMARLCAHQLRACAAHSGAEWQRLGRPGGRVIHQFT